MILDVRWDPDTQRYPLTIAEMHQQTDFQEIETFMRKTPEKFQRRSYLA